MVFTLLALLAAGGAGWFARGDQAIGALLCGLAALLLAFGID